MSAIIDDPFPLQRLDQIFKSCEVNNWLEPSFVRGEMREGFKLWLGSRRIEDVIPDATWIQEKEKEEEPRQATAAALAFLLES